MSAAELLAKQDKKRGADAPRSEPAQVSPEKASESGDKAATDELAKSLAEAAETIRQDVGAATSLLGNTGGPGVDVRIEGDSVVLSLTDTSTFGMFAIGSAEPNADLVRLLQSIAPVLTANGDHIVLRGHTDARPYKTDGRNNNWRLAMARAEAAYAMLLRSGIDERRFERIEAYADRKLKIGNDPSAAANRRIEIVLRKDKR
jgi:chemotaxis protein MotB